MGQAVGQARVEDRYYLQKVKLGQGAFGTVWRAVDRRSNAAVAIKQMDKAALPRRGVKKSDIEREITVMRAVQHENVTRLLDTFEDYRSIYLALEYCDGGDFGDKVKERASSLREPEAADWVQQICSAIFALHSQNICHRDIKPDNFMVNADVLKLADFGLAVFLDQGRLLSEKCGTPAFMAPEQHRLPKKSRGYGHACDMWAAGVCTFMLMCGGRHPFLNGNHLDEKRLLQGSLEFSSPARVLGFEVPDLGLGATMESRFSEKARDLCRRMVDPQPDRRAMAIDVLRDQWLAGVWSKRGEAPPAPMPRTSASATAPSRTGSGDSTPILAGSGEFEAFVAEKLSHGANFLNQIMGLNQPQAPPRGPSATDEELQRRVLELEQQLAHQRVELEHQLAHQRENLESQMEIMTELNREAREARVAQVQRLSLEESSLSRQSTRTSAADTRPLSTAFDTYRAPAGLLPVGTRCRYLSSSYGDWFPAVVQGFNEEDGTYNLDCREHARLDNISPSPDVSRDNAWPQGTPVYYESSSMKSWLPAIIESFNERTSGSEGTYNLDVRDCASMDRIRPRHMK